MFESGQRGAVLIISLVMLLLITVLALTGVHSSNLQMLMAGNAQSHIEAREQAQSILDGMYSSSDNLPVMGAVGDIFCDSNSSSEGCGHNTITLPSALLSSVQGKNYTYTAVRKGPEFSSPPRLSENQASSASSYEAARFEMQAVYDETAARGGRAELGQGVLVLVPKLQ